MRDVLQGCGNVPAISAIWVPEWDPVGDLKILAYLKLSYEIVDMVMGWASVPFGI